jgi:hypothetical protein
MNPGLRHRKDFLAGLVFLAFGLGTGPANVQTAPPGHYMLFVLNEGRVPSVARFVRLIR